MTHAEHDCEGGPGVSIIDIFGAAVLVFVVAFALVVLL